jgi:hypothetical protein
MDAPTTWLLALMTTFSPPERASREHAFPGWAETPEQRVERYRGIASAVRDVVYDPSERPVFGGPKGRAKTGALLLAIAWHESGYARDVDLGPCWRGRQNDGQRCDFGRAHCLMQIHARDGATEEGWTPDELKADRSKCFRAGLHLVQKSFAACKSNKMQHRLAAFASGRCSAGQSGSERLLSLGERFFVRLARPGPDYEFLRYPQRESGAGQ